MVDLNQLRHSSSFIPSNNPLSKPYVFKVNPTTTTQITSLPGGVKKETIRDDYKIINKNTVSYDFKSRNDYLSKIDCLNSRNSTINAETHQNISKRFDETAGRLITHQENDLSSFGFTSIPRYQSRNNSNNTKDLLNISKTNEINSVNREMYNNLSRYFGMSVSKVNVSFNANGDENGKQTNGFNGGSFGATTEILDQKRHGNIRKTTRPYIRKHLATHFKII